MLSLEHPSVQDVLEIAEEIANENKFLDTHTLYQRAKRRLKIPRKGLLQIIQLLIDNKFLVDGSKFTRDSVLDNQFRNYLFQIILYNQGIHFSALKRKFYAKKMGSTGQLVWHLDMLIKFNYIKKISFKNYSIFVPSNIDDEHGLLYFLLRDNTNKNIFYLFIDQECIEKLLIYEKLGKTRETIYYHLKELENCGLLVTKDNGLICISTTVHQMLKSVFEGSQLAIVKKEA